MLHCNIDVASSTAKSTLPDRRALKGSASPARIDFWLRHPRARPARHEIMAVDAISPGPRTGFELTPTAELACFALCVANVALLAAMFMQGSWLVGADGAPVPTDFVNFWAAGRQVLDGHPDLAYVSQLHKEVEAAAVGHSFDGDYPLIYPPTFLFVATLLGLLPYLPAFAAWTLLTFPAYVIGVRRIVGHPAGILLACAFPAVVSNFAVGQNGFLITALLAGTLTCMERRPILAGCLLGLLSFKPHLGLLFPLVLIADTRWRTIAAAATVVTLLAGASLLVFGIGTWEAFIRELTLVSHAALADGVADLAKLQSVFGVVRVLGGGENLAWLLQAALSGAVAIALCVLWRSRVAFDLKAAALATGALLATPYLFVYDLAALAVPMAYLLRIGARTGALPGEMLGLGGACLLIFSFPFAKGPVGLAAVLVVALLIARRVLAGRRHGDVDLACRTA
jgi:arabinofuranan 3-O-arabinosyltransferase